MRWEYRHPGHPDKLVILEVDESLTFEDVVGEIPDWYSWIPNSRHHTFPHKNEHQWSPYDMVEAIQEMLAEHLGVGDASPEEEEEIWQRVNDELPLDRDTVEDIYRYGYEDEEIGLAVVPIYVFDHSGVTLQIYPFSGPDARWDSGVMGWVWSERWLWDKSLGKWSPKRVRQLIDGYVDVLNDLNRGRYYCPLFLENGEIVDSICGVHENDLSQWFPKGWPATGWETTEHWAPDIDHHEPKKEVAS